MTGTLFRYDLSHPAVVERSTSTLSMLASDTIINGAGVIAVLHREPFSVMAIDAVALLRRKGFRAHRMEHGVSEWRAQGWRVDTGPDIDGGSCISRPWPDRRQAPV